MLTPDERRILLYMTDDERHTVPEIARMLQIAVDVVTTALQNLERLDLVCSAFRLIDGKLVQRWSVYWHRAERRKIIPLKNPRNGDPVCITNHGRHRLHVSD